MNQGKLREVFVDRFLRSLYGNALWMDDGNLIFGILIDTNFWKTGRSFSSLQLIAMVEIPTIGIFYLF